LVWDDYIDAHLLIASADALAFLHSYLIPFWFGMTISMLICSSHLPMHWLFFTHTSYHFGLG